MSGRFGPLAAAPRDHRGERARPRDRPQARGEARRDDRGRERAGEGINLLVRAPAVTAGAGAALGWAEALVRARPDDPDARANELRTLRRNYARLRRAEESDEALTHRSYGTAHYERLEFLGDAILSFVVADHLHANCFAPELAQVLQTKGVQTSALGHPCGSAPVAQGGDEGLAASHIAHRGLGDRRFALPID